MHDHTSVGSESRPADDLSSEASHLHDSLFCWGTKIRLEILAHLACGEICVGDLSRLLGLDNTLVSKYLKALSDGGIVLMRKDKKRHLFRLSPSVEVLCRGAEVELRVQVKGGLHVSATFHTDTLGRLHRGGPLSKPASFAVGPGRDLIDHAADPNGTEGDVGRTSTTPNAEVHARPRHDQPVRPNPTQRR